MIQVIVNGLSDKRNVADGQQIEIGEYNDLIVRNTSGRVIAIFQLWQSAQVLPDEPKAPSGGTV